MNLKLHNKFELEILDNNDNPVRSYVSYNTVKDFAKTQLKSGKGISLTSIYFGKGSTIDKSTNTLTSHLGVCTGVTVSQSYDRVNHVYTRVLTGTIEPDVFNDTPISELGVGAGQTYIYTHSLITNSLGEPISITKTSSEKIKVTATVYITFAGMPEDVWVDPDYLVMALNEYFGSTSLFTDRTVGIGLFNNSDVFGTGPDKLNVYTRPSYNYKASRVFGTDIQLGVNIFNSRYLTHIGLQYEKYYSSGSQYPAIMCLPLRSLESFKNYTIADIPVGTGDNVQDTFNIPTYITDSPDKISIKVDGVPTPDCTVYPKKIAPIEYRPAGYMYYDGTYKVSSTYQKFVDGKNVNIASSDVKPIIKDLQTPANLPAYNEYSIYSGTPINDKYAILLGKYYVSSYTSWYVPIISRRNSDGTYTHITPEVSAKQSSYYVVNAYPHPTDENKMAVLFRGTLTLYTVEGDSAVAGATQYVGECIHGYAASDPMFYSGKNVYTINWDDMTIGQTTVTTPDDYSSKFTLLKTDTYAYLANDNTVTIVECDGVWGVKKTYKTPTITSTLNTIYYCGLNSIQLSCSNSNDTGVYVYGYDINNKVYRVTGNTYSSGYYGNDEKNRCYETYSNHAFKFFAVKFNSPVGTGKVITADLKPTALYKTEDWVLNLKLGFEVSED